MDILEKLGTYKGEILTRSGRGGNWRTWGIKKWGRGFWRKRERLGQMICWTHAISNKNMWNKKERIVFCTINWKIIIFETHIFVTNNMYRANYNDHNDEKRESHQQRRVCEIICLTCRCASITVMISKQNQRGLFSWSKQIKIVHELKLDVVI